MNRRYMMQEMYQQFLDEDDAWKKVAKDQVRKFALSSVTATYTPIPAVLSAKLIIVLNQYECIKSF